MYDTYGLDHNMGENAETDPIIVDGETIYYKDYGNSETPNDSGGYMLYYPRNKAEAESKNYIFNPNVTSANWVNLVLQYLTFSRNSEEITLHEISFVK
jgi:hypothetical protein